MKKPVPNPRRRALAEQAMAQSPASGRLYEAAKQHYAGGAVGANVPVFPWPLYFDSADGAHIIDVDGRRYIDCWPGHGTILLGHNYPVIRERLQQQLEKSWMPSGQHPLHIELAQKLKTTLPQHERFVLCNSGTEAAHKAITLARASTGKDRIVKLAGTYHGSFDQTMLNVRSEYTDCIPIPAVPYVAGIAASACRDTIILPMNKLDPLQHLDNSHENIAAVLVEPVTGYGLVEAQPEYLHALAARCKQLGILLIMDEIFSGFRDIPEYPADIYTYGKVVGGGMPIGIVATRRDILEPCTRMSPPLLMGGTFSGNPICLSAACGFLDTIIQRPDIIADLAAKTRSFVKQIHTHISNQGYPISIKQVGSLFCLYGMPTPPIDPEDMKENTLKIIDEITLRMRINGVIMNPTGTCTLTHAHNESVMTALAETLIRCIDETFHA